MFTKHLAVSFKRLAN